MSIKITQSVSQFANRATNKIGKTIQGSKTASKVAKAFEPNGGDNSFFGLASIMLGAVLIPRVRTALKRNPDNKEATKDEITEILFRDVQTILIMLFALKSMNSVIGNLSTKLTGVPMVNKPLKPIFSKNCGDFVDKAKEFAQHPVEKMKTIGSNILAVLNPIGGSKSLSGGTIKKNYSSFSSYDEIKKFYENIPNQGGNSEKVFDKMKKAIIKSQQDIVDGTKKNNARNLTTGILPDSAETSIKNAKENIEFFEKLTYKDFMTEGIESEGANKILIDFFENKDNALAYSASKVNACLRTLALGIEVTYLGFGLPALNQRRLEKKYLSEKPIGTQHGDTFSPINDRHIKAQEIKLYSNFIKNS